MSREVIGEGGGGDSRYFDQSGNLLDETSGVQQLFQSGRRPGLRTQRAMETYYSLPEDEQAVVKRTVIHYVFHSGRNLCLQEAEDAFMTYIRAYAPPSVVTMPLGLVGDVTDMVLNNYRTQERDEHLLVASSMDADGNVTVILPRNLLGAGKRILLALPLK